MATFTKRSFFLASNYHTYGIQHAFYYYLQGKGVKNIYFLNHPLHGVMHELKTTLEIFNKHNIEKIVIKRQSHSEAVNYLYDLFLTLKLFFGQKKKIDVYIGFNSVNTLPGLLLKLLGRVKFVITYSHSYKEHRYINPLLNSAYKFIDALVIRFSDSIWGLSDTLSGIRKSQGVPKRKIVLAATGVDTTLIKPLPYLPEKKFKLLFVGLINSINGIELVIDAMPKLLTLDARITLDVVGEGEDLPKMKEKVKKYGLQNKVHFFKVMSIEELSKKLPQCGIGLATYQPLDDSTLKTTDPMKTKLYMAAGLPIISTDVYKSAHEIDDEKLGKIIAYNVVELVKAVGEILNEKTYQKYRANCLRFVRKYDWEHVFDIAISHTKFL